MPRQSLLSVDEVTSPSCLPVTPALSAAQLELSHLIQVELLLPATTDGMADARCCHCYVPTSRLVQATSVANLAILSLDLESF